jgi:hypothetical protein
MGDEPHKRDGRDPAQVILKPVLGTADLCLVLEVGETTVQKLVSDGRLARLPYSRRHIKVSSREVWRFIDAETEGGRGGCVRPG